MADNKIANKEDRSSPYDIKSSNKKGLHGFLERLLRRFNLLSQIVLLLPLYIFASFVIGVCLIPGILLVKQAMAFPTEGSTLLEPLILGSALAGAFFITGFSAMIILPLINRLLVGKLKEWKGPYYSTESVRWYIQNGILYLLRYSFLEFITPSPLGLWFYSAMGMKIGRGSVINSTHISDPSLIEMGKRVTIGGSATIVAHYGQGGFLVLSPVKIEDEVTVGLRAIIMGGVTIGKGAKILPNSVVMPKTVIPAGEVWGGVPATKVQLKTLVQR